MDIVRTEFFSGGAVLPLLRICQGDASSAAVIIHGFGGNKEEMLGLAYRVAELGCDTFTPDLRGHGENACPLSIDVLADVNALIDHLGKSRRTVSIGHSLGGRLSLLSRADVRIGVSPALPQQYSQQTTDVVNRLRRYRTLPPDEDVHFGMLEDLPTVDGGMRAGDLILYGERDIPEIVLACRAMAEVGHAAIQIPGALHGDICYLEPTFLELRKCLGT
jgi:hypothetical protein